MVREGKLPKGFEPPEGGAGDLEEAPDAGPKKQISLFVDFGDWRRLRNEAARQGRPITAICREQMEPLFRRLREGGS